MSSITIIKEIKTIHPNYVALVKIGGFYRVYGKDAYIISELFQYKLKKEGNIISCGFPVKTIKKVVANLENKKINYIILDSRNNYNVDEKIDFKNLNTYINRYEQAKIYVNNQMKIEQIYEYLSKKAKKEELKILIKEIEEIINAKGKI